MMTEKNSTKRKVPKYDYVISASTMLNMKILVGGGLRNSSNTVLTKLYTEILRSSRANP